MGTETCFKQIKSFNNGSLGSRIDEERSELPRGIPQGMPTNKYRLWEVSVLMSVETGLSRGLRNNVLI